MSLTLEKQVCLCLLILCALSVKNTEAQQTRAPNASNSKKNTTSSMQTVECSSNPAFPQGIKLKLSISDSTIAESKLPAENGVYLTGKSPGKTSVFIWDTHGNIIGADVQVNKANDKSSKTPTEQNQKASTTATQKPIENEVAQNEVAQNEGQEIESWIVARKFVLRPDVCLPRKLNQIRMQN